MDVTGEKGIGKILKIILQICFYTGIASLIILPFVLNYFGFKLGASAFIVYPNGIVLLVITKQFIKLFDSLQRNTPFSEENVKTMKKAGITSFVGAIFWLLDLMYEIVLAKSDEIIFMVTLIFLCFLYLGVTVALYILAELFKQAIEYKKENELTI